MNDELKHYGILGMKWGVRRFQNKDGSLTPAGRKRYDADEPGKASGSSESSTPRVAAKSASDMTDEELTKAINRLRNEQTYNELTGAKNNNQYQNQQSFVNPPSSTMALSNAELQAYITRLDLEKRYSQLTAPPPKEVSAGKKFMQNVVTPAFNNVAKLYMEKTFKKLAGLDDGNDKGGNDKGGKDKDKNGLFNKLSDRLDKIDKKMTDFDKKMSEKQAAQKKIAGELDKAVRDSDTVIADSKSSKADERAYRNEEKQRRKNERSENTMREANTYLANALSDLRDTMVSSNYKRKVDIPKNSPVWETTVSSYSSDLLFD